MLNKTKGDKKTCLLVGNQYFLRLVMAVLIRLRIFGILVVGSLGFTGCATLQPAPFQQYAQAVHTAQSALDKALSFNYAWARSGFAQNFQGKFSELLIQPGLGYQWSMRTKPLYLTIKQARTTLFALNSTFADYASLLVRLSEQQVGDPDEFSQLAKNLNTHAKTAAQTIKLEASQKDIAIFSLAATEAARGFIRSKHLADLEKVIQKNQSQMEQYCKHCISLVHTLRSTLKTYYVDKYAPIQRRWKASHGKARTLLVEELLTLNESFADQMRLLQEIENMYKSLPEAHADLAKPIKAARWQANRQGLERLIESGKRLHQLYAELKAADKE